MMNAHSEPRKYRFARLDNPFLDRMRDRAREIVEEHGETARRDIWIKAAILVALALACYAALFVAPVGLATLALALLTALALTMVVINIGHDASHGVASSRRIVNDLLMVFAFGSLGVSGHLWRHRHLHNHHMFSNLEGADSDVDATVLLRFHPNHEWRWFHRFQPIYAPVLYGASLPLRVYYLDWFSLAEARRENPRAWATWRMTAYFAGSKVIHVCLVAAPILALNLPLIPAIAGYLGSYMAASTLLTIILVGTHIHEEAEFPMADEDDRLGHDWGAHVVMTSCDWAPESRAASFLFGGLNAHTAHHLLPQVPHALYQKLSPILQEEAEAAGLPYHRMSLREMLVGHYRHLVEMSRKPENDAGTGAEDGKGAPVADALAERVAAE